MTLGRVVGKGVRNVARKESEESIRRVIFKTETKHLFISALEFFFSLLKRIDHIFCEKCYVVYCRCGSVRDMFQYV